MKVDLRELADELESLSSYLDSKLKVKIVTNGNNLFVNSESLSPKELKRLVNKFVYRKNLNNNYWVELEGYVVKLRKFKHSNKKEKQKEGTTPSTINHGW